MNRAFSWLSPLAVPFAFSLVLTGCAASGEYPSLARRPAERISGTADVVPPEAVPSPPPAPPSADLTGRLAQLVEQARGGHERFAAKRADTERLVSTAGNAAPGSEAWSVANVAVADLDSARNDTVVALGTLDELYATESVTAGDSGGADAAAAAHAQVGAWVDEEEALLSRLRGQLKG
jgi:hypothetical protein